MENEMIIDQDIADRPNEEPTAHNDVLGGVKLALKRNMLKWHVGHQIFCPRCDAVMDRRRAVEVDVLKGDRLIKSVVVCASCWDQQKRVMMEALVDPKFRGYRLEVTDGRELFGRLRHK